MDTTNRGNYEKFREYTKLRSKESEVQQGKYNEDSNERLKRSIERKFRTTFIGALSEFERAFGPELGNGLPPSSLTDDQYRKRMLWEQVRNNILNNGNKQLRAAKEEIGEYTITWNRHTLGS